MSILITRSTVIPFWLLVCAILVAWSPPSGTVATSLLILVMGLSALAMLLLPRSAAHAPVTNRLPTIALRRAGPPAWPNSGFRNIGRGTKGG
jgi:hypothetical protein